MSQSQPRYSVGRRVAIPLEGRTGCIDSFDTTTGRYKLIYHDGYEDYVAEDQMAQYVVASSADSTKQADADPLIGSSLIKEAITYDEEIESYTGVVSKYNETSARYCITYSDGKSEELTSEETMRFVETYTLRDINADEKTSLEHSKKRKRQSLSGVQGVQSVPCYIGKIKFSKRASAYLVVRKILLAIVDQNAVKKMISDRLLDILMNNDVKVFFSVFFFSYSYYLKVKLQPKTALEMFVEAGGMILLQKVLVLWMRTTTTHIGALLVLKTIASLPGVTPTIVLQSGIGKTLRDIVRGCQTMDHLMSVLGDVASWIINAWKRDIKYKTQFSHAKDIIQNNADEVKSISEPIYLPASCNDPDSKLKRANTKYLQQLLEDTSKSQDYPAIQDTDQPDILLPRYNSLGSEVARRLHRPIVLIDSLAAKINHEHTELIRASHTEMEQDDPSSPVGRIKFGNPRLVYYQSEHPVMTLLKSPRFVSQPEDKVSSEQPSHKKMNSKSVWRVDFVKAAASAANDANGHRKEAKEDNVISISAPTPKSILKVKESVTVSTDFATRLD